MAVLPIRLAPDPVLSKKAAPVPRVTKRVQKLIKDMADTMYDAQGVGLAAPQVGVLERVIVVDVGEGLVALVNPKLVAKEGLEVDVEGCLSIPGISCYVERAAEVEVEGWDEKGNVRRIQGDGLLARALQHELDHLDGVLITDIAETIVTAEEDSADGDGEGSAPSEDGARGSREGRPAAGGREGVRP